GLRQDFLADKPIALFFPEHGGAPIYRRIAQIETAGGWQSLETTLQPRDGAPFTAAVTLSIIRAAGGESPVGLRWMLRDMTEWKKAGAQIQDQLRRITMLRDINEAITSTLDLPTVLDLLLEKLEGVSPYPTAATVRLFNKESGELEPLCCRNIDAEEWRTRGQRTPGPRARELLQSKSPSFIRNVQTDPRSVRRDFYIRNGLVSYLGVPLIVEEEVLGMLCMYMKDEHEFSPEEVEFFSSVGTQAAIAIQNSRLYGQIKAQSAELRTAHDELESKVEERTAELTALKDELAAQLADMNRLHDVSTKLLEDKDLRALLAEILRATIELTGADMGNVQLYDEREKALKIVAHLGYRQDFLDFFQAAPEGDGVSGSAMEGRERVVVENVATDPRVIDFRAIYAAGGIAAVQSTPLFGGDGSLYGMLSTHFERPRRLSERELRLLDLYAQQAERVIERKKSEEALRESEGKLRALTQEQEQQLIASDRLVSIGELSASIAHEFNNPLQIIMGFAQELLDEAKPADPHHEALKIIEAETRRCRDLIRNLLNFARPARAQLERSAVEPIIRNSVQLAWHYLLKSKIRFESDIRPGLPPIQADANQLQQVLINLLFNAAEAMPDGGTLRIRAALEEGELAIAVSDTGTGISADALPNIFRPFFTTKKKKGMGLGLSICERIVRTHGGHIIVESAEGKGATFYLRFPATEEKSYERAS
ncbi:MAG TPA: GAF domain-containing protein, partial [Candidatus Binatia bacterium]